MELKFDSTIDFEGYVFEHLNNRKLAGAYEEFRNWVRWNIRKETAPELVGHEAAADFIIDKFFEYISESGYEA